MIQGQEVEIETLEFRQLEVEFDLVTTSDPSARGLNHIRSEGHSRLIAIDNRMGRLYFAIENAIVWTDISHALARKVEENTFKLDDREQVIHLVCSNDSLLVATTKRILKLFVEDNVAKLVTETNLLARYFVIVDERIHALLQDLTIDTLDLRTLKHVDDGTFPGEYAAVCTDGHKMYVATSEGAIEDSDGGKYGRISGLNTLHCTSDGVLIATKDLDVFIYRSSAWTHFSNPTRASSNGTFDIESISGWHSDLPLLIIVSHSASLELAVLGVVNDSLSQFVLSIEDALPQFPLSSIDPDRDCCPVSVAIDFTNSQGTITSDEVDLPPMPLIWSLTTDGTLVPFRIVRRGVDETRMFSRMNPLKAEPSFSEEEGRTPLLVQKPALLQVIENMQLEAPAKKEPAVIPVTMDLGGIQNLIVQEFMRVHGWIEQDLHKLRTLTSENRELCRQVEEETLRLLRTRAVGDEPCKFVEEDMLLAEEFERFDKARLLRVQRTSRELHLVHGRLQALLDASEGTNLESRMQSISLEDVATLKPLGPESPLTDIQARLERLQAAVGHLSTRIDCLQGNYPLKDSHQASTGGYSQSSRELLKSKLLGRPAGVITVVSEGTTAPPLTQLEHPGDLSTIHRVLSARNKVALSSMPVEEVTAVAEALPKQDTSIFRFPTFTSKTTPSEQSTREHESELSSPVPVLGTSPLLSEASKGEKVGIIFGGQSQRVLEAMTKYEEETVGVKIGLAVPSTSSTELRTDKTIPPSSVLSLKGSETSSKDPLLPTTTNAPLFSFAPLPSPSTALSLSLESTTLRSSETPQGSEQPPEERSGSPVLGSLQHDATGTAVVKESRLEEQHDFEGKSMGLESSSLGAEIRMTEPPIPKLFAMLRRKEMEDAHKDMPPPPEFKEESAPGEVRQQVPKIEQQPSVPEGAPSHLEAPQLETREDAMEKEEAVVVDQPLLPTQEHDTISAQLDSIDDAFGPEGMMTSMDSSLEALGKPLEDKGQVRTIFGVAQAKQDTLLPSTTSLTSNVPFGNQHFAFRSTFGQYTTTTTPQGQPQFEPSQEGPAVQRTTPEQPPFPSHQLTFGQASFGRPSFGQSPFAPFGTLNAPPPTPLGGSTFASYSGGANAFASLAQQSPQKQQQQEQQAEGEQEGKPALPPSFTTFRD